MAKRLSSLIPALAIMIAAACISTHAFGQADGGGGGAGGGGAGGGGAGGGGAGGGGAANSGGIEIDAKGVLRSQMNVESNGQLDRKSVAAAKAKLGKDVQAVSELRKVSLNRLEAEVKRLIDAGQPVPDEMSYLAGMTRITHVFFYPESNDIVIAGPAEGFFHSSQNRVVGIQTGSATLQLQDLIVALRAFGPDGKSTKLIACSIDPTQEGLARLKAAIPAAQQQFLPGDEAAVVNFFKQSLGMQTITVEGISPKTHFAQVLVDADYHMKLIGIGLERTPTKIISYIDRATPTAVSKNALQRWFFQPDYQCVSVSTDQTAMQLVGGGVKLVGENERVANDGSRSSAGGANGASKAFCNSFTNNYDVLAQKVPLYGELRNLMDMSIAAAFVQNGDWYQKSGWNMEFFGNEAKCPVQTYAAPTHVESVVNAVWKGSYLMTPIGGGVNIQPRVALNSDNVKSDEDGSIAATKEKGGFNNLSAGRWWWD